MNHTAHVDITATEKNPGKKQQFTAVVVTLVAIYLVMAFFCAHTPWVADDWGYGRGTFSLTDIFQAQVREHFDWCGRFIGHFLMRCLLRGPSWLHPLLSPLFFVGIIFLPVILVFGSQWKERVRVWHILFLFGMIWFAVPAFGTVFFWRTGTPDYGYTLFFVTLFLAPYRLLLDDPRYRPMCGPLFFFNGILAGWSNENLGILAALAAIAVMAVVWKRGHVFPLWTALGITGAIAGWFAMVCAPGNFMRLAAEEGVKAAMPLASMQAFKSFWLFWGSQQLEMLPLYILCIWALWRLQTVGRLSWRSCGIALAFFIIVQMSLGALILSPGRPLRAMTATVYFFCLCVFAFVAMLPAHGKKSICCFCVFCFLLAVSIGGQMIVFAKAVPITEKKESALRAGDKNILVYEYPHTNKYFFPGYDIREVNMYSSREWENNVPWEQARRLTLSSGKDADVKNVDALVSCNIVYLNNVPDGKVYLYYTAHDHTVESLLRRAALLVLSPPGQPLSEYSLNMWYRPVQSVSVNGKAAVYARGIHALSDIVWLAVRPAGQQEQKFIFYRVIHNEK